MAAAIAIGMLTAVLVIVQAFAITDVVVPVFQQGADFEAVKTAFFVLAAVIAVRVAIGYLSEAVAFRAAAQAKSELRAAVLDHIMRLGPVWLSGRNSGELTALMTRGIDGLDAYFSRYLPQLVLAVVVPIMAGAVILVTDPLAALIVLLTLPLIPVFMVLIGLYTQRQVDRQWRTLGQLSAHFGDIVSGMATLKIFGRGKYQAEGVREVGDQYRTTTMGVLRVSFLSALVLEILAMLSVAMVAVSIGLRLVDGSMTLQAGLLVLILVPEVYLPLRQVGVHFHAAAEGLGAARTMLDIMDVEPVASGPRRDVPDLSHCSISFHDVSYRYPDRQELALDSVSFAIAPRRITALVGPSGAGKSTALSILERFADPCEGAVRVETTDVRSGLGDSASELRDFDVDCWRGQIAYVGQEPALVAGTIAENIRLAAPQATDQRVLQAVSAVDLTQLIAELPAGLDTVVGEGGRELSQGQSRRVALARAFCSDAPLVLLDEPTASLDGPSEDAVLSAIAMLSRERTVVMAAHRPALISLADDVVELASASVVSPA
ncbi:MAG: thiol reductant ABC exporter subunit CydD [Actinomycetes bacterium]